MKLPEKIEIFWKFALKADHHYNSTGNVDNHDGDNNDDQNDEDDSS